MANPIASNTLPLNLTLTDSSGTALNLTGATVVCKVLDPTGIHLSLSMTITNATAGQGTATLSPTQTANAGTYRCSCKITFNDATTTETDEFDFVVSSALF